MRIQFGDFCLDGDGSELSRRGAPIHLTSKALQLLSLLIANRPAILSKKEIHRSLWPSALVDESNLSVLVSEVRTALGDDARRPTFIRTVHGYGYGFVADVGVPRSTVAATTPGRRRRPSPRF
jgi:DNA-binding winged helix-turn-helix (wHTH) protein